MVNDAITSRLDAECITPTPNLGVSCIELRHTTDVSSTQPTPGLGVDSVVHAIAMGPSGVRDGEIGSPHSHHRLALLLHSLVETLTTR